MNRMNEITTIDREALAFLGKNYMYLDEAGKSQSWRPMSDEAKLVYEKDKEKYDEFLSFLGSGEAAEGLFAMRWLHALVPVDRGDGETTPMAIGDEVPEHEVVWTLCETRPLKGAEPMHSMPGPRETNVSILYAKDTNPAVDRSKYIPVIRFWLVDWENQTLSFVSAPEVEGFRVWSEVFPLLREFRSLPAAMQWVAAREAFIAGRPQKAWCAEFTAQRPTQSHKEPELCLACTHCGKRIEGTDAKVWVVHRSGKDDYPTCAAACSKDCASQTVKEDADRLRVKLADIENQGFQVVSIRDYLAPSPNDRQV